jgi:hypothetical protein
LLRDLNARFALIAWWPRSCQVFTKRGPNVRRWNLISGWLSTLDALRHAA